MAKLRNCALVMVLLLFAVPAFGQQSHPVTTVMLVRHGEKMAEPANDPPLSPDGLARAEALYDAVRDAGLTAVYSSNRARTLGTARYVANKLQIPVIEVPIPTGPNAGDAWATEVASRVRKNSAGKTVMVVGHSNTYGSLIGAFGGPKLEEIVDERYDDLFVLSVQEGSQTRLLRTKYGKRWAQ